jgi:hypothetical protein
MTAITRIMRRMANVVGEMNYAHRRSMGLPPAPDKNRR